MPQDDKGHFSCRDHAEAPAGHGEGWQKFLVPVADAKEWPLRSAHLTVLLCSMFDLPQLADAMADDVLAVNPIDRVGRNSQRRSGPPIVGCPA
jgi:hypothetical protein